MSGRVPSDIQIRTKGQNAAYYVSNARISTVLFQEIIQKEVILSEKTEENVYTNQEKSLSDLQTFIEHSFPLKY